MLGSGQASEPAADTEPVTSDRRAYDHSVLSPDARRLAVTVQGRNADVWIYDLTRATWTRLTLEGDNNEPVWSPDGKRVAFRSNRTGKRDLFWMPVDGSGGVEQLTHLEESWAYPTSFSPDGNVILFSEESPTTAWGIGLLPLEGDRKPRPFLATPAFESLAAFSPNGRWVAYVSDESGRLDVYVRPYPGPGPKWPVSAEGGSEPVWARDGRELFYRNGNKMMAVSVRTEPDFSVGSPQLLFEAGFDANPVDFANYDVSPDGQRFVMVEAPERADRFKGGTPIRVYAVNL